MKTRFFTLCVFAAISALSTISAPAILLPALDFDGTFAGFYAPNNWITTVSGNTDYIAPPVAITTGAPVNLEMIGAVGNGTVPQSPSILDYSIVIPGGGAITVSFTYGFFDPAGDKNFAQLLDNGVVVANLNSSGSQFVLPGVFHGGDTLDFRLLSTVVNLPDVLEIAPVPEPSTLALATLSAATFLLHLRRRKN